MTYNYPPIQPPSGDWGTNYPPRNMTSGSSNYPPVQPSQGLQSRAAKARELDPHGNGSGYRPFWDFDQEAVDASALAWQVTTNVNGELTGLYIQAPYGYSSDLLRSPKSKILSQIADEMESQGHSNWAEIVRKDQVSGVSWRSSACQAFGFSYDPAYPVDKTFLQGLSSWQPYGIGVLHPELFNKLSEDEIAKPPKPSEKAIFDMISTGGWVGAAAFAIMGLASSAWLFLPAALCGAIGYTAKRLSKNAMKANAGKKGESIGARPGYVLKTTSGWAVMLFDSSTHASPADLSNKAMEELNSYLEATQDPDSSVGIIKTYTSTDGKMTFFQSDRPLQAECELSPYKAEQYLSLFARHQAPALKERAYTKNTPTVINGTMMLQGIKSDYEPNRASTGFQGASEWSPEAAAARAAARTKEMESQVLSALRSPVAPITGDTEKARFMQIVKALQTPGTPNDVKSKIQPKLNDLHASIKMLTTLSPSEAQVMQKSIDDQLTEMESQLGASQKTQTKKSVADDLMASFQSIVGDSDSSIKKVSETPIPSPAPSTSISATSSLTPSPFAGRRFGNPGNNDGSDKTNDSKNQDTLQSQIGSVVDPNEDSATPELQSAIEGITASRLRDDGDEIDDLFR